MSIESAMNPKKGSKYLPALIGILQRIVQTIGISVEVLGVEGILQDGIGREVPAEGGGVEAGVHIDEAPAREVFVSGVAVAADID